MRIAVVGGTGTVGRHVVQAAHGAGHETVVVARSTGIDVLTGEGLERALAGVEAVVDVANQFSTKAARATAFFTAVSRRLQEVGARCGVSHIVTLSIVGIDRVPGWGYYEGKVAQEAVALGGPVPGTLLRATQFHEFPGQVLDQYPTGPFAVCPRMRVQPVAASTVADRLVELAAGPPVGRAEDLGGPEPADLRDLARRLLRRRGSRAVLVPLPVPGKVGRALSGGALLPGPGARLAGPTFDEWLRVAISP